MDIRSFQQTDTDAVVQLWRDCGLVKAWNDPLKDIQRKLQVMPELFLVGEIDHTVVASVMGGYDGHRGWANYLAVSPQYQKRSIGRQLMQALETRLLEIGCPKINLQIRTTNTQVIDFYSTLGYNTDECVSMGKRLIPD